MSGLNNDMPTLLGTRVFSDADQQRFATESRDFNPMHVDPVAARRLLSGRQVVHGVHTLIQALDLWPSPATPRAWSVQCSFGHPVSLGDRVEFWARPSAQGHHRLSARVEGITATDIVMRGLDGDGPPATQTAAPARSIAALSAPLDDAPTSWVGQSLEIPSWQHGLADWYPRAAALVGRAGLADLARLSFLVGMVCPGLHSVFGALQFSTGPTDKVTGTLRAEVTRYDPRFGMFSIAFRGTLQGELRAFLRPKPQGQPSSVELLERVEAGSWAGRKAFVVGGSRGLGELTAKLLGAAGCDVTISHASGREDALAVARDIEAAGAGRCSVVVLDLARPFEPPTQPAAGESDAVFYFATPRIIAKRAMAFRRDTFDSFAGFYLQRFHELCLWLETGGRPVRVYLPSTVFIAERPDGMAEYAMVKAAAEVLADELNRTLRHVRIICTRLPRMATDQTASIMPLEMSDSVEVMLGVVKAVRSAISAAS